MRELNKLAETQEKIAKEKREFYENLSRESLKLMREREGITEEEWNKKYGK